MLVFNVIPMEYSWKINFHRPPNSDELNIDCLPTDDSPRKPHNLKVLQADTSKLKKQIKILTVS